MAKFSLVARVGVSKLLSALQLHLLGRRSMSGEVPNTKFVRATTRALILLLLLGAKPAHAQTTLNINTHWADGLKCTCTIVVKQMNANGTTTQIFQGVTDDSGRLSGSVNLQVQGVYSLSISSNAYNIPLFTLPFSTGLVAELPLKSATLNFVFSRPSVNGQPIQCCALPANYTKPALASGTGVQFGI